MTDEGTQFTSSSFMRFAKAWNFIHDSSSPHFHQANGAAERAVRTAKEILEQEDPLLALLTYRSTPIPELGASPAELAFGRRIRTTMPMIPRQLDSPVISREDFRRRDNAFKNKQKLNHDRHRGARSLPTLKPGDSVMIKLDGEKRWVKPGRVREVLSPRSYSVETDGGGCVRRNRRHLQRVPDTSQSGNGSLPEPGAARIGVGPKPSQVFEAARPGVDPNSTGINNAARPGVDPNSTGVTDAACLGVIPKDGNADAARPGVEPNEGLPDLTHNDPPDIDIEPEPLLRRSGRNRTKPKQLKDFVLY